MRSRFLSILLFIGIMISIIPGTALPVFAAIPTHSCNDTAYEKALSYSGGELCINGSPADNDGMNYILPSGNYYLTGNINITDEYGISIYDATVNLCLGSYNFNFSIETMNSAITITESNVSITACEGGGLSAKNAQYLFYVYTDSTLTVNGGNFVCGTELFESGKECATLNSGTFKNANGTPVYTVPTAPSHEHNWAKTWNSNSSAHWHECLSNECDISDNTGKKGYELHQASDDDGDCETPVKCPTCQYIFVAEKIHTFTNDCDTDCDNSDCTHTRATTHTPNADDGDCTTAVTCSICGAVTTAAKPHNFTNNCDTTCNNNDCTYTRSIEHTPNTDDGDCTTAVTCSVCGAVTTAAKPHSFTNDCDTDCNNSGCNHTRMTEHTPNLDDNNCATAVTCSVCGETTTATKSHSFTNACDIDCNNNDCTHTRATTHTPNLDDGDCTTAVTCSICGEVTTAAKTHNFTNNCDTTCNNSGCTHTRLTTHSPNPNDGDCTTAVTCSVCGAVTTTAKSHSFTNACDTDCNNAGCTYTRSTTHTPNADDGDCTTAVTCSVCGAVTTAAKPHNFTNNCDTTCNNNDCTYTRSTTHTPNPDDGDCTTAVTCSICGETTTATKSHSFTNACDATCNNSGCAHTRLTTHIPNADDGDCTTAITCSVCGAVTTAAKPHNFTNDCDTTCNNTGCTYTRSTEHTPNSDDGDCETAVTCSVCGAVTTAALSHIYTDNYDTTCNNIGCIYTRQAEHIESKQPNSAAAFIGAQIIASAPVPSEKTDDSLTSEAPEFANPFTDVSESDPNFESIMYVTKNGIMNGTGGGATFSPDMTITRGMIVTMLWRLEGTPAAASGFVYTDVPPWCSDAVMWASDIGIINGYGNGISGAGDNINNEQLAAMMYRYAKMKGCSAEDTDDTQIILSDTEAISDWAVTYVRWAIANGILDSDGNIRPLINPSRGNVAGAFHRFMINVKQP